MEHFLCGPYKRDWDAAEERERKRFTLYLRVFRWIIFREEMCDESSVLKSQAGQVVLFPRPGRFKSRKQKGKKTVNFK